MMEYIKLIDNPPQETKGYTRWWWYGCAVTKKEIDRQLKFMFDANIGGVEIQILYSIEADNKEAGIRNIPYGSPEFFDMIRYTVHKADELGMKVDFTLGSSWPFGGSFVPNSMSTQSAIPYQIDVSGPCNFSYDFTTRINGDIARVIMGEMIKGKMIESSIIDITDRVKEKYLFSWSWGEKLDGIHIPEGEWKIVAFVINKYRQMVGAPSPNGEGYVIDHCRKDVSDFFFKNAGNPIIDKIGKGKINSFFCDSIELSGNNWTEILFDEFKRRRGYDLQPYIYALWGEIGDITPYVRYDYFYTMSELTIENFFQNMTNWCRENGSESRIQVHGTWGDILKAYATADIPEGETFGEHDKLEVNTIHRRFASSAGHIYGKPIISNESFTWLKMPRFIVTLENMKAAVDAIFLDGINMIVNHGYAYSPEESGKTGWAFYASSHISHTNTWWPYYKEFGKYIQTVSAFMRKGRHSAEIAIYTPLGDVWSDNPMCDLHLAMKMEEHIGRSTADKINKAGYYFDYINDDVIVNLSKITNSGLIVNENPYRVILLIGCSRLPVATAERLKEFVGKGGILIATEKAPDKGCGLSNRESDEKYIKTYMKEIFSNTIGTWKNFGEGKTVVSANRDNELIKMIQEVQRPDVCIKNHNDTIGYIHRIDNDNDIYFFSNISKEYKTTTIEFKGQNRGMFAVDPLSGKKIYPTAFNLGEEYAEVEIRFEPFQSMIVIFTDDVSSKDVEIDKKVSIIQSMDISANWELNVVEIGFKKIMETIDTWERYQELKYYSGDGYYTKEIEIPNNFTDFDDIILKIEQINEAAEIYINEKLIGNLWKAPRKISIKKGIVTGRNIIKIKATNLLINYAINPNNFEENYKGTVMEEWPYFTENINQIRQRRLFNQRERDAIKEPLPSGISGKVEIEFLR